ncbi:MAG: GTPase ObgE, partial [Clostridia bacterium]|nr:GTPase ObgE [Clostridia bacterium]
MKYDFYDEVKIHIKAGNGGNGAVSFRRDKYISHGGPDGGDGGRGGNIVFVPDKGTNTLLAFKTRRKFVAGNGGNGSSSKFHGENGTDCVIRVPEGTVLKTADGAVIRDMSGCDSFIAAKGGNGGWGNRRFATPTRQAPRFAKNGLEGEEKDIVLELKMLADVGLVGMPNAGKSSLLTVISAARPKIANYPFTTLQPNLGVVSAGDDRAFTVADIPGLIEGASEGEGLGFTFLRHVERCRMLIHLVDISGMNGDPCENIDIINGELKKYSASLSERPQLIVANKTDIAVGFDREKFSKRIGKKYGQEPLYISAATGEGVDALKYRVAEMLSVLPPIKVYEPEAVEVRSEEPLSKEITAVREKGVWYVEGEWLKWLMGGINFDDRESLAYFDRMLRESGTVDMMRKAGIKDG